MKRKLYLIFSLLAISVLISGVTYSAFHSEADLKVVNQKIAQFVFEAKQTDSISLPLTDFVPGDSRNYTFEVANKKEDIKSNVTLNYQITLESFHFIPFEIKLYEGEGENKELVLTCDESYARNEENKLVCNAPIEELKYHEGRPVINEIQRVSLPGRRVYSKVKDLPKFYNGLGIFVLSTPQGVMSDHEARQANVGGEVLCKVF